MPKSASGKKVVRILAFVPMHRELARGTLKGVLELAQVDEKDLKEYL